MKSLKICAGVYCALVSANAFFLGAANAFQGLPPTGATTAIKRQRLFSTTLPDVHSLRVKEIKDELKDKGISYIDCFDRESLANRLEDARVGKVAPRISNTKPSKGLATEGDHKTSASTKTVELDATTILSDLKWKDIKELKLQCSRRNLRYATFLEKEDFVQAIWKDMQKIGRFSVSGALRPGSVVDVTGEQLDQEVASDHDTPLLVDVYATWCGPCKMQEPELGKAAAELGTSCRVAKIDSDQHPQWASRYRVQGLPTILLIHKGQVRERLEGAHSKATLLELGQKYAGKD